MYLFNIYSMYFSKTVTLCHFWVKCLILKVTLTVTERNEILLLLRFFNFGYNYISIRNKEGAIKLLLIYLAVTPSQRIFHWAKK